MRTREIHLTRKLALRFLEFQVIKLIDFGCAVHRENESEAVLEHVGTPFYTPPEVLRKEAKTLGSWKACDMWTMGVIVYFLMKGQPPFDGLNERCTTFRFTFILLHFA